MKFCRLKYVVLHEIPYYIKCKLWHRYNILKIKTLPPTWCDRNHLLVHAMFQILSDFIEKEKPDLIIDWDSDPEHRQARDKMDEILNWWENSYLIFDEFEGLEFDKIDWDDRFYPKEPGSNFVEMKPSSENDRKCYEIVHKRELDMEEELEKKLRELLDIRRYLWT